MIIGVIDLNRRTNKYEGKRPFNKVDQRGQGWIHLMIPILRSRWLLSNQKKSQSFKNPSKSRESQLWFLWILHMRSLPRKKWRIPSYPKWQSFRKGRLLLIFYVWMPHHKNSNITSDLWTTKETLISRDMIHLQAKEVIDFMTHLSCQESHTQASSVEQKINQN